MDCGASDNMHTLDRELVRLEPASRDDTFFELGMHLLLGAQTNVRMREASMAICRCHAVGEAGVAGACRIHRRAASK